MNRTAKLAVVLAITASVAQAQITITSGWLPLGGGTISGPLLVPYGSASAPSIGFAPDADGTPTGIYSTNVNQIGFLINGALAGRFDSNGLNLGSTQDTIFARGGTTGALRLFGGTTPTQSGTTCGTGPTLAGNNSLGSVTLGTTPGLPCTIVFNGTWTNAPKCFLDAEVLATGTTTVRATGVTTTQFVITSTAALVATDKVSWHCVSS
jgi:hypothetical protein